uniref:Uncharacterized protein n=1 Tax=Eutreptiella gymnastica TaxID=73025 RepID=A0A7S1IKW9_9EUGL|mmetsp:Transcript_26345/g.47481  ORF Transcript_26345/g.47481 Transcript_26345/m.47481 type:complete len:126 (+) Transcript_26345:305-682(+)
MWSTEGVGRRMTDLYDTATQHTKYWESFRRVSQLCQPARCKNHSATSWTDWHVPAVVKNWRCRFGDHWSATPTDSSCTKASITRLRLQIDAAQGTSRWQKKTPTGQTKMGQMYPNNGEYNGVQSP